MNCCVRVEFRVKKKNTRKTNLTNIFDSVTRPFREISPDKRCRSVPKRSEPQNVVTSLSKTLCDVLKNILVFKSGDINTKFNSNTAIVKPAHRDFASSLQPCWLLYERTFYEHYLNHRVVLITLNNYWSWCEFVCRQNFLSFIFFILI